MNRIRTGLFALALMGCFPVLAQQPVADIGIEVSVEPDGVMPPGTEGAFSIVITNFGPDTGAGTFRWNPTDNGAGFGYPPLEFTGTRTGPCRVSSFGQPLPGDNFGFQIARDIPSGESRTCTYGFRVPETTILRQVARWSVAALDGLIILDDPNEANNVADVLLIFAEPPAPVSVPATSAWAAILLALLLGWTVRCRVAGYPHDRPAPR